MLRCSTAPVRNASRYRSLLEASLPDIFESLQARPLCSQALASRGYKDEGVGRNTQTLK